METAKFDLLFTDGYILPMDEELTQIPTGYLAVNGMDIASLGPMEQCPSPGSAERVINCAGCVVMPGLINCNTHLPMIDFRGMADDLPLATWLSQHIFPAESKHLSAEFVHQATLLAAAECIRGGVTCVNDMYLFAADVARACAGAGLRAFVGEGVISYPTPSAPTWRDGKRLTEELIAAYAGHPLITPTVCVHAPYSCDADILRIMHELSQKHRLLYHIHLHESENEGQEIAWAVKDETPTGVLARLGVLGARTVAAHCVWLNDDDIRCFAENGASVAHCPTANLKLASGVAPLKKMLGAGLAVGVGTDGAASNNNLNLWEEVHLASLLAKGVNRDSQAVPARQALGLATSRAARALNADHIGSLAPGKRADVIVVEMSSLHLTPRFHHPHAIYSHLVYSAQAADVRDTVVNGQVLMRERKLLTIDEEGVKARAQEWVNRHYP
ncbi:amidohydrolase [bacterium]|nr:amidohydrolase [bacterium]